MAKHTYDFDKYDALIAQTAPYGESELFRAQIYQESQFDEMAQSPQGAKGIAQFLPSTFRQYNPNGNDSDIYNPDIAIPAAARYMYHLIDLFKAGKTDKDDYYLAMAAYNAGEGRVAERILQAGYKPGDEIEFSRVEQYLPKETRAYVAKIDKLGGDEMRGFRVAGMLTGNYDLLTSIVDQTYKIEPPDDKVNWLDFDAVTAQFKSYAILIPVWAGLGILSAVAIYFTVKQSFYSKNGGSFGNMFAEGLGTTNKMLGETIKTTRGILK